jgi:hypothetical protein
MLEWSGGSRRQWRQMRQMGERRLGWNDGGDWRWIDGGGCRWIDGGDWRWVGGFQDQPRPRMEGGQIWLGWIGGQRRLGWIGGQRRLGWIGGQRRLD